MYPHKFYQNRSLWVPGLTTQDDIRSYLQQIEGTPCPARGLQDYQDFTPFMVAIAVAKTIRDQEFPDFEIWGQLHGGRRGAENFLDEEDIDTTKFYYSTYQGEGGFFAKRVKANVTPYGHELDVASGYLGLYQDEEQIPIWCLASGFIRKPQTISQDGNQGSQTPV